MILPLAKTAPLLTMSQHACPFANSLAFGSNTQRVWPGWARSRAKSLLGNGPTTYIVLPTTKGCPSCPARTPVVKWNSSTSVPTLLVSICFNELKRVPSAVPAGVVHSAPAACAHAMPWPIKIAASNTKSRYENSWIVTIYSPPSVPLLWTHGRKASMLDRTSPYYNGAKSTVKTPGQLRTFPGLVSMDLLGDFKTQTGAGSVSPGIDDQSPVGVQSRSEPAGRRPSYPADGSQSDIAHANDQRDLNEQPAEADSEAGSP